MQAFLRFVGGVAMIIVALVTLGLMPASEVDGQVAPGTAEYKEIYHEKARDELTKLRATTAGPDIAEGLKAAFLDYTKKAGETLADQGTSRAELELILWRNAEYKIGRQPYPFYGPRSVLR